MTVRRSRMLLWLTTVGLLVVAAAGVALHLNAPVGLAPGSSEDSSIRNGRKSEPDAESQRSLIDIAELHQVAGRDIRQQLFDPPVVVPPPPPPKPLPPIELLVPILRSGSDDGAKAWVRDGQVTRKVEVGSAMGPEDNPVTVKAIKKDRLILEHEGREVEVVQSQGGQR